MKSNQIVLSLSFLLTVGLGPLAAQPMATGPETRVDTLAGDQYPNCPKIGVAPDRSFEISWDYGGTLPSEIKARHYNASGAPTDPMEVLVDSLKFYPVTVAVTPVSTGFRVLMQTIDDLGGPSTFYRRRIDPNGVPAPGAPRVVGTGTTDWVVPGPGDSLFAGTFNTARNRLSAQQVDALGTPTGTVYVLNSRPVNAQTAPWIAPLADGGWVAVFTGISIASPGSPARQVIRARRFNAAGHATGPDFDVNSIPLGLPGERPFLDFGDVAVAAGPFGGFAVSWAAEDDAGNHLYLRFFNAAGIPTAPEAMIAEDDFSLYPVAAAFSSAGRLLLLWGWTHADPPYPRDLHAQLFTPKGAPLGPAFDPASAASGPFIEPFCGRVAWAGDSWLITWASEMGDSEPSAVFLRRFR